MSPTFINPQRQCVLATAIPERAFGRPAYDGTPPSALLIPLAIDLGSFRADWQVERVLVNKTFEGSAFEGSDYAGRILRGSLSIMPQPPNIKIVANWGMTLFGPYLALPWESGAPASRAPDTDGEIASWTLDHLDKPTAAQAIRYTGVLFTGVNVEASLDNPGLRYSLTFTAKDRSTAHWTTPNSLAPTWTEPSGSQFLFKNASIYLDEHRIAAESFRLSVTNPVTFDGFDEDGLAHEYGMGAQQAEMELVCPLTEENADLIESWHIGDPDFEADIRALFVHPASIRRRLDRAYNAGASFFYLSPEYVGSPGTAKTEYTRLKDQDVIAIEGVQIDSPLNTAYSEVFKVDGSQGPGGVSPSGIWGQVGPSEGTARYHGIRRGFASGAYLYSIAHEIGLFRAVLADKEVFDDRFTRKARLKFIGLSDGASEGGQLVDTLNPPLNVSFGR